MRFLKSGIRDAIITIRTALRSSVSSDIGASIRADVRIDPKDNPGLLLEAMRTFEGSGQISFEGIDRDTWLSDLAEATHMETDALRSASLFGSDDFVVIPLTSENIAAIWKLITWEADDDPESEHLLRPSNFIHVQIATSNRFVFGAYDNFRPDCVAATNEFPLEILDRLVVNGVIRSYKVDTDADRGPISLA